MLLGRGPECTLTMIQYDLGPRQGRDQGQEIKKMVMLPLVIPPWPDMPTNVPSPGIPTLHWALPSPSHRLPASFLGTDFLLDLSSLLIVWEPDPCSSVQVNAFSRPLSGALSPTHQMVVFTSLLH